MQNRKRKESSSAFFGSSKKHHTQDAEATENKSPYSFNELKARFDDLERRFPSDLASPSSKLENDVNANLDGLDELEERFIRLKFS